MPVYKDVSRRMKDTHMRKRIMGRAGILLHSSEGHNSVAWLLGEDPDQPEPASACFLIARNGDINQLVPVGWYSLHAGTATWHHFNNARGMLNELLVGIEFESHHTNTPRYTDVQLVSGAALVNRLLHQHLLSFFSIDSHGWIARPPGRRTDPVNFPFRTFAHELQNPSKLPLGLVFPEVLP